jgi:response regulator RpfG family c-di-GMP phosphodiesterase
VYDALGSRRAYKEPWPRERIEKLFAEEAGKHFDPELSAILIANMDEVEQVRDAFPEQEIHAI